MISNNPNSCNRFPFTPFPAGVFAVAFSREVRIKQIIPIIFMGKKIALFRTVEGKIGALASDCPDLGGKLAAFEKYGLIFLTHNPQGNNLNIQFPEWNFANWGAPIEHSFKLRSHPQEILENSVDKLHFCSVHKYSSIKTVKPLQVMGSEFLIHYLLERSEGIFGRFEKSKIELHLDIHAYGLGLSKVEVYLPKYKLSAKQIVFPVPIDGKYIYVRALTSIKIPENFSFLPSWITPYYFRNSVANYLTRLAAKGFLKDFLPDLMIWENKKYIANPRYLPNDGEFEKYRVWAAQFYNDNVE